MTLNVTLLLIARVCFMSACCNQGFTNFGSNSPETEIESLHQISWGCFPYSSCFSPAPLAISCWVSVAGFDSFTMKHRARSAREILSGFKSWFFVPHNVASRSLRSQWPPSVATCVKSGFSFWVCEKSKPRIWILGIFQS